MGKINTSNDINEEHIILACEDVLTARFAE